MNTSGMTWGKIVLVFQAVVTLLIGVVLFLQVISLDQAQIQKLEIANSEEVFQDIYERNVEQPFIDVKNRYKVASYILLVVSLIEILIISRFV